MKKSAMCVALLATLGLSACGDGKDGGAGLDSLVSHAKLAFGSEACWFGGLQLTSGLDKNRNGTLDAAVAAPACSDRLR